VTLTAGYGPKSTENIASEDPAVVQNCLDFWARTFPVLKTLGVGLVGGGLYSYWPVDYSRPIDKDADLARSVAGMKKLAAMAEDFGITLCMEVLNRHEGYLLNTAAEGLAYVKAVGEPNVKVMLDTYHMNFEEDSFEEAIRTAGAWLGHVHIGECNRRPPRASGRMPWAAIGSTLREIGYDGSVVMEPFVLKGGQVGKDIRVWRDLPEGSDEASLDEAARISCAFVRDTFEGEKRL
jgi:D-psicose/D-tagatose/L-ribulose 3-epimerase